MNFEINYVKVEGTVFKSERESRNILKERKDEGGRERDRRSRKGEGGVGGREEKKKNVRKRFTSNSG